MPAQPTAGPAGPDTDNPQYRWNVLIVVMIGTMMAALDSSIVNISLPDMMAAFGVGVDDIEWVATGYMLAYAVFIPMAAWFKDRLGHRNLYLAALAIFTLGSLLCGLAWNLPSLIAARVLQALGGGFLTPIGMSMVSEVFPPKERGRALGLWGVGVIAGPALGPTLGGYLTKNVGWRSIFLVNIPIGVVLVLMGLVLVKRDRPHPSARKPFDTWGFLFLATFLVCFLLGLSKGEHEGWTSTYILTCFSLSALSAVGFFLVESLT
ncbi:MAG TPA: DHA2 family efflux MFS transporter permease subunit, partial [bacterium]|nr:DHA2 family efflux MFS transporter permease subunit [bacterium]